MLKQPDPGKIAAAALRLAAKGWSQVTIQAVAAVAKIPPAKLRQQYSAPADLIPLIAAAIDREAFAQCSNITGTSHDRLFDLLMARFDILQKHRSAIVNMAAAAKRDRALACSLSGATMDSAYRVIAAAKLTAAPRPVMAVGIAAIYTWSFCAWRRDESRDMSKTMSALDRALRLAGKAMDVLTKSKPD